MPVIGMTRKFGGKSYTLHDHKSRGKREAQAIAKRYKENGELARVLCYGTGDCLVYHRRK